MTGKAGEPQRPLSRDRRSRQRAAPMEPVGGVFAGRNLSDFWELAEKSPVINYTVTSSLAAAPGEWKPPRRRL